ncbi:MAG: hypothetical protein WBF90_24270 [Rivularia sp. (in: cyanobacteria)]
MSELKSNKNNSIILQWQEKIKVANRNNIFCLDFTSCINCGSDYIERISCWQFPNG